MAADTYDAKFPRGTGALFNAGGGTDQLRYVDAVITVPC